MYQLTIVVNLLVNYFYVLDYAPPCQRASASVCGWVFSCVCVCVRVYMCASTSACTCACSLERLLVHVHVFKSECGTRWSLTQASAQIDKSCSARCHFHLHQQLPRIREHARPPSDRPPPSKNYERRNESWPSRMAVCSCFRRTSSHV